MYPPTTEPSTCPQIPFTNFSFLPFAGFGPMMTSHVEVPIDFTSTPGAASPPIAPMWQSNAPQVTITLSGRPNFSAHSFVRWPQLVSVVYVSVPSELRISESFLSNLSKNFVGGYPFHSAFHITLCPAGHLLRFILSGAVVPVSIAGIQSQCSTAVYEAFFTALFFLMV